MGLSYQLLKILRSFYKFRFYIKLKLFGFDYANAYLRTLDRQTLKSIITAHGAKIDPSVDLEAPIYFHNCYNFSNLEISAGTHIGKNVFFDLTGKISIGENCTVSMGTTFLTHLDVGKSSLKSIHPKEFKNILIMDNVYIGANSTILMGVTINDSAFVAACSLVRRSIESNLVVGGVPATELKSVKKIK